MAESIDELFDCFEEGVDEGNEELKSDTHEDEEITNRYVAPFLT